MTLRIEPTGSILTEHAVQFTCLFQERAACYTTKTEHCQIGRYIFELHTGFIETDEYVHIHHEPEMFLEETMFFVHPPCHECTRVADNTFPECMQGELH